MTTCFFTGSLCRSNRGSFHPPARERGPDTYNRGMSSLNSLAGPARESQDLKRDKGSTEVPQGRSLNHPSGSSVVDPAPSSSVVLRSCTRSNLENPLNQQNKDCHGLDSLPNPSAEDQRHARGSRKTEAEQQSCGRETENTSTNSGTSTWPNVCDEPDSRKGTKPCGKESASKEKDVSEKSQSKLDRNRAGREQREVAKSSCGTSGDQRRQHASSSTPDSSRSNADAPSRKEELQHKQGQERPSRHTEVSGGRSEKSSSDKSHQKTEKRGVREHHRKEERRQECTSSSERRHTRSDGIREYDHRKTQSEERNRSDEKNVSRGERRSTRSETSKEPERQSARDSGTTRGVGNKADKLHTSDGKDRSCTDVRENRRHASPGKPQRGAPNLRKDLDNKRRTSGRTEESSRSKASGSHDDDIHSVKESIKGKGRNGKEKLTGTPDKGSKNAPDNVTEGGSLQADGLANTIRKSPVRLEESSPKRKLSFMETLNLTVSPIKKQNNSERAKGPVPPVQFEFGEEFCVVDEVEDDSLDDSAVLPAKTTPQQHVKEPATSLEVKAKEPELTKRFDGDLSKTLSGKMHATDSEIQEDAFVKSDVCPASISEIRVVDKTAVQEVSLLLERPKQVSSPSVPLTDVKKDEGRRIGSTNSSEEGLIHDKPEVQNDTSQQEVDTSVNATATTKTSSNMDPSVCLEVVSSTVGVDNNRQSKETVAVSATEVTQGLENPDPCPGPLVGPSVEAIDAQEEGIPPEQASPLEPDSTENELEISRPSGSVVVPHDEDSMMMTLSNIKVIPEAISPLTSPVRQIKKSQQQRLGKEPHVKSLSKGWCTVFLPFYGFGKSNRVFWFGFNGGSSTQNPHNKWSLF